MISEQSIPERSKRILIVEDSPTQALRLRFTLEMAGFSVDYVHDGYEALEILKNNKPNLVISDVIMPKMDGYMLCKQIRESFDSTVLPVILLTGLSEPGNVIQGLECGANGFISKPYSEPYLLARITDIFENHVKNFLGNDKEINFYFDGKQYSIIADRMQILEVLISTYSTVIQKNEELAQTKDELSDMNNSLEKMVSSKTVELTKEIEEHKRTELYLQAQHDLAQILSESSVLEMLKNKIFDLIHHVSSCDLCCLWDEAQHGTSLRNKGCWFANDSNYPEFLEFNKHFSCQKNVDLLGKAWAEQKIEIFDLELVKESSERAKIAYSSGLRTWVIIPILASGNCIGAMEFYWKSESEILPQLTGLLRSFCIQIGEFIAHENLQQQYLQAQKMESVGQLTGGIAHDFNNLLMVIQGALELLSTSISLDEKSKKYVDMALDAVEKGADFNRRLLAFSRKQLLQPKVVNVAQSMLGTLKLIKPLLGENIEINLEIPESIHNIFVDPVQFENALVNLSVNARDAMSRKGKLLFEASNVVIDDTIVAAKYEIAPGEYVKVSISDNGAGIPSDLLDRVFDPFFTTKAVGEGTGLGLSMVYGFVKQSKGYVTIYSELNIGTTINLYLPKSDVVPEKLDESKASEMLTGTETILVVEDEDYLREIVIDYLKRLGYKVFSANQAELALEILEQHPEIQLLFTDVVTPGELSGVLFAEAALKKNPKLKVLFTSGYPKSALESKADKGLQIKNFLAKPYKIQELAIKVRQVLTSH